MKYFLDSRTNRLRLAGLCILCAVVTICAVGELPSWIRNAEAGTAVEAVFFRMMSLPNGAVAFRRPPSETRAALSELIKTQQRNADLYSLRALEDEQQLDFAGAESDWKSYAEYSSDKANAQLALADFYHQRLRPGDEIKTLSLVANAPAIPAEKLVPASQQRSWHAFERIFGVIQAQGLPKDISIGQYRNWISRYPQEESLYAQFLQFLIAQKEYVAAGQLVSDYRKQFPNDQIFPVKAKAMLEYRRGSVREGLSVYEQSFQPLWDPQLVKSYFDLLRETQNLRSFRDNARAALLNNPEDLNATARTFYYYQQQGKTEAAVQAITDLRLHKEASKSSWTSEELYICARLLEDIHSYPEAARYYFALYNSKDQPDAQEIAIAGLTNLLLTAPETPIRFGSGELSMYRDIATMDQGPGYLNGILSLILNTTEPARQYAEEEQRAVPYFHRGRAVELLALLDEKFPNSPRRAELHAKVLEFYANAAESDAVIQGGREFLAKFPTAPQRTSVALLMADAYARKNDPQSEFAIYDSVLEELAAQAQNIPVGTTTREYETPNTFSRPSAAVSSNQFNDEEGGAEQQAEIAPQDSAPRQRTSQSFQLSSATQPAEKSGVRSPEYSSVLERYLARLVQMKQIPAALAVLRHEIDRNPDDPGLYERLAAFLDQNRLGSQQEEIYRRAIERFSDKSWYDKLARFYLRHRRNAEFEQLTRDAIASFRGTDLEQYFNHVVTGSPGLYLRLNLYAHDRFPHNPVFVRNLLWAYQAPATRDLAAWEALLRQHWFEEAWMRNQFFEFLSRTGKLESELAAIRQSTPDAASWEKNPAAADFIANANLWRSHFEESAAPLKSLANQYPADAELAHLASSVHRSLAYFDPANTAIAAKIEDNLLQANPTDTEIMARIGDIYADREQFPKAVPYWERIPQVAPGKPEGYLEAATIYWDYFDFDNAIRLLAKGRDRLSNPNLYAYEMGAIYENQRDYPRAISEYVRGSLAAPESSAELRLLELARRPKSRDLVDKATKNIAAPSNPAISAVNLRVKVLEAQNRKAELETLLDAIATGTSSIEQAEDVETLAQQKSLETVRQHALEKQAALTTDPVTRMQLRYSLIQLYEGRKDFTAAQRDVEALYHENPRIVGVVRSTVDFYWRMKMQQQAIDVLLQAAKDAYPELSTKFTYDAARKETEAQQFQQARELLTGLLKDSPYNSEYLAAMADTYARAGDDHGLEQYYKDKIAMFRSAPLPGDARKAQVAALRRGLIPALTRMDNYSGAVDQYIELINSFPEDEALVTEAALYALRYQRQQQLTDFYAKTVAQSPRDYRWSMVLARIQTNLENYPAAIDTYVKSIAIRPDRADLYIARAGLEERLMRFDEAAADYERIYQLAYKDPQWMEKLATVRARQGKTREVVAALQAALIDGRPENAGNYFEVARRLEGWGMLEQARSFADKGIAKAGPDLLASSDYRNGVTTYVRVLTRLRQHELVFATLQKALDEAGANLPVVEQQIQKQGFSGLTDAQWRDHVRRNRIETARTGVSAALQELGSTVNKYFTPEERLSFAHFADSKCNGMPDDDLRTFAIPLAESAGLADQEARWRFEWMMHEAGRPHSYPETQSLIDLQRRRGRFAELASQMEQFAGASVATLRNAPLLAAADAYRSAGDEENELRLLGKAFPPFGLDDFHQQRYFRLLLARKPDQLVRLASVWSSPYGERAANFVVAHGSPLLSHEVVRSRSKHRPAVWNKSYNALVGLYFAEPTAEVNNAFVSALGDDTIAARLAKPVDRDQQLAGNVWFYYGSRYGEYLGTTKLGPAEDYLPAILEQSPATASGYVTLADYYAGAGENARAIEDYNHALELTPSRPDIYDNIALAYYKQGDRTSALASWKQAFLILEGQLNSARTPETFWADFGRTCDQLAARRLFPDLKPHADRILRAYLRHNGNYRSNAILHSAFAAAGDAASGVVWIIDLSSAANDPALILADVADVSWIPLANREPIYQRILQIRESKLSNLTGLEHQYAQDDLASWQVRWIQHLVRTKQYGAAASAIAALPKETRDAHAAALVPLNLQSAAQLGTLDSILAGYRADPQGAPAPEILRTAARKLFEAGDKQSARKILELVFAREISEHQLVAANFLGLAEIRLASGDTAGALDLLRRLVVVVGNPFENLDPAAALLEKTGHNAEAVEFLDQLVQSAPWDASYRLRLAKAKLSAHRDAEASQRALTVIASDPLASYELRLQAAASLSAHKHPDFGSGELDLIASPSSAINPIVADKFYYYEARIRAAQNIRDSQIKIQLLSHAEIDFPRCDIARIPLFEAAIAAQSDEYAIAVMEPLLQTNFLNAPQPQSTNEDEQVVSSGEAGDDEATDSNASVAPVLKLSPAEQARIAQLIGDTMARLDRMNDAASYYQTARRLDMAPQIRKVLFRKWKEARSAVRLRQRNAERQPLLHEPLDQDRIVRPRLLAQTANAIKPAAPKGVVQQ